MTQLTAVSNWQPATRREVASRSPIALQNDSTAGSGACCRFAAYQRLHRLSGVHTHLDHVGQGRSKDPNRR